MSKIFFDNGISLDGYFAGENRGPDNPLGDGGTTIHTWMYHQRAFLKNLGIDDGDSEGADNRLVSETLSRTGAYIMGKRMFEEGEVNWPENLYKTDVFVLTHEKREPWKQKGNTTFYFVNDGIESAVARARQSAGGKDIRIQGGAMMIQQFLNAGLVDECLIHIAPLILGSGIRLFEGIDADRFSLSIKEVIHSTLTTHIRYEIRNK
ncbi:dihydrofolate reductase family protein [Chitinophaga horti]|uniref:Dihydrofolate reductase family protein n=1 Tax=Chitinophaga horti TaxID=2920382 RepID=A0ABY6J7V9_9BACT|nr:dihydrofolate reductase family protein [Chitinophaga horti]UYQ95775.1 dihydrofolate reductase family protein [Chitinophaga horti]